MNDEIAYNTRKTPTFYAKYSKIMLKEYWLYGGMTMRQWAYLREPYFANKKDMVYKIMLHELKEYTLVYLYCSKDAVMSAYDHWYPDLESALEEWNGEIDSAGWHRIEDTFPDCQDDCIEPVRVKGRDKNNPQWGKYEILKDGVWIDYDI